MKPPMDGLFPSGLSKTVSGGNYAMSSNVPEYADLQYDDQHRKEILDYLRNAFKQKTLDQWDAILGDLDICWGRVQSLPEVLEDPLFRATGNGGGNRRQTMAKRQRHSVCPSS